LLTSDVVAVAARAVLAEAAGLASPEPDPADPHPTTSRQPAKPLLRNGR
jgi:hypothetical protein